MLLSEFWSRVDRSGGADACWPWQGAINASGYGSVWVDKRARTASRVAYELANGEIERGDGYHGNVVMHTCDNRPCCNPKHLVLGSQADNNRDRDLKGRADDRPKGERVHNARFTQGDISEIRASRLSLAKTAAKFGCSKSAIAHVKSGRSWSWLDSEVRAQ